MAFEAIDLLAPACLAIVSVVVMMRCGAAGPMMMEHFALGAAAARGERARAEASERRHSRG